MMMLILRLIVTWVICHCNNNLDLHFPGCLDSIFVCLTMSTTTHYCNYSRCVCVCAVMVPCLWPHNDDTNDMLMLAPVSSLSSCRPFRAVSSMKNSRCPTLTHKPCLWFSLYNDITPWNISHCKVLFPMTLSVYCLLQRYSVKREASLMLFHIRFVVFPLSRLGIEWRSLIFVGLVMLLLLLLLLILKCIVELFC